MANTGGGWIVLGVDDKTHRPDHSLSPTISATYDTTQLSDAVDSITQGNQPIRLAVFKLAHPETQAIHPMIQVRGFERTPFVCRSTKTAPSGKSPILQEGKVYIRRPGAATSELQRLADWEDLLSRCVSQRRDELLAQFADLSRRMTIGGSAESEDAIKLFDDFKTEQWSRAEPRKRFGRGYGFMETAHMLMQPSMTRWPLPFLQKAVATSGLYSDSVSVPKQSGVEIRVGWPGDRLGREYRYLDQAGSYYLLAALTEDYERPSFNSSMGHPASMLWIDFAIHRIVATLLDSMKVYRALDVAPDEPYLLSIRHGGLRARSLYASSIRDSLYYHVAYRRASQENAHLWQREVTQDFIQSQYLELTTEIANSLFALFEFTEVPREVISGITNNFVSRWYGLYGSD